MRNTKIRVGITHGDINGISYEVILNTLLEPHITDTCTPIIYGSAKACAYHRKALNINNITINAIRNADEVHYKKINLINCVDENVKVELGKSTPIAGEASYIALDCAVKDLKAGKIDVLVTAPINKSNIQSESFKFKGHTDFLQYHFGNNGEVLMLMASDKLRVGVVTDHIPLKDVVTAVTTQKIISKLKVLNRSLIEDFGVRKPRIAVLGINPHAGDNGVIGNEDETVIAPALKQARDNGVMAFGPYPADGFFGSGNFKSYDAVLAMYHDQGLTPFKCLVMDQGVNYTAGLPIIRTSPAHGTAYEIAGKGEADCASFRNALFMACDIFNNRTNYKQLVSNQLKPTAINANAPDQGIEDITE